jgi:hypothetical protein
MSDVAKINQELLDYSQKLAKASKRVAEICDRNRDAIVAIVGFLTVPESPANEQNELAEETRRTMAQIKTKDFISANEASVLFGCSAQHLRNLVQRALDGKATYPIPFRDLDGVVTFPVSELLEWSRTPKPKAKKPSRRNKSALRVLAS